jgi:hypothetical protein
LKIAYRDKLIRENINDFLEKIEKEYVKKQYLTLDKVKLLSKTPCDIPVLKQASLFSCLTGLRISDILNLKWEDFEIAPDMGYCLCIRTQKNKDRGDVAYKRGGIRTLWQKIDRQSIQGIKAQHGQLSIEEMDQRCWLYKAYHLPWIPSHLCDPPDSFRHGHLHRFKNADPSQCIYHADIADLVREKKRETVNKISLK